MYSTYIQRIEIALLSDPRCIQITLTVEPKKSRSNIRYNYTIRECKKDIYNKKIKIKIKFNKSSARHMADRVQTSEQTVQIKRFLVQKKLIQSD